MGTGVTLPTKSPENFSKTDLCTWNFVLNQQNSKHQVQSTKIKDQIAKDLGKSNSDLFLGKFAQARICCLSKFYGQAKGLISSGQLSTLLHLHIHPINVVVYHESHWQE